MTTLELGRINQCFEGCLVSLEGEIHGQKYSTSAVDGWSIDKVYYNVPEPTTLLLLGLGAVMLSKH